MDTRPFNMKHLGLTSSRYNKDMKSIFSLLLIPAVITLSLLSACSTSTLPQKKAIIIAEDSIPKKNVDTENGIASEAVTNTTPKTKDTSKTTSKAINSTRVHPPENPASTTADTKTANINLQICAACQSCCEPSQSKGTTKATKEKKHARKVTSSLSTSKKKKKKKIKTKKESKTSSITLVSKGSSSINTNWDWIKTPLYGSTIAVEHLSPVTMKITGSKKVRVNISKLFAVSCTLRFNQKGEPTNLSSCSPTSKSSRWTVRNTNIPLTCLSSSLGDRCTGRYTLTFLGEDRDEIHKITLAKHK